MNIKYIIASVVIVLLTFVGAHYLFLGTGDGTDQASVTIPDTTSSTASSSSQALDTNTGVPSAVSPTAQQPITQPTQTKKTNHMVTIETNYGTIVFQTYDSDAPHTVTNFVTLANKGFYDGLTFHRVIPGFMIQGGDPSGNGTGGPGYTFNDELDSSTASYKAGYTQGVVAMANSGPNTNGSQFFIMDADYPLPNAYTIFGKVVSGQDVVDKIAHVQTGANDKPVTPVIMKKVTTQ